MIKKYRKCEGVIYVHKVQKMSETEKKIMQFVWQAEPPVTASEIQTLAGDLKEWKHTTVATFLQKLCQKNILRVVKKGNTNLYYPEMTEDEYLHFETISFLDDVHHGSLKSFMSALCNQQRALDLNEKQIAELKEMIEKL